MIRIRVARIDGADPDVPLPAYESDGAAGADVRASFPDRGALTLAPGARALVPTGLRVEIPRGYELQVRPRSGLALKHGLTLPNAPGTIDSDYRGELGIIVLNTGQTAYVLQHGVRIAQLVVAPVLRARFDLAEDLSTTARDTGGFGSTGTT